jgi:hypothetical protein
MNNRELWLDAALQTLFRDVDTTAAFEARVLARLQSDLSTESAEEASLAREVECERYRNAALDAKNRLRAILQGWAVDGLGVAALSVVVLVGMWERWAPGAILRLSEYLPYIATLLGASLAIVPLVGMRGERSQHLRSQA